MNAEPDLTMREVMRLLNVGRQALRNALAYQNFLREFFCDNNIKAF